MFIILISYIYHLWSDKLLWKIVLNFSGFQRDGNLLQYTDYLKTWTQNPHKPLWEVEQQPPLVSRIKWTIWLIHWWYSAMELKRVSDSSSLFSVCYSFFLMLTMYCIELCTKLNSSYPNTTWLGTRTSSSIILVY